MLVVRDALEEESWRIFGAGRAEVVEGMARIVVGVGRAMEGQESASPQRNRALKTPRRAHPWPCLSRCPPPRYLLESSPPQ